MRGARIGAAALSLCLLLASARAQDAETHLYVVTSPFGARITLDGALLDRPSPLLLRGLPPGAHRLHVEKPGFYPADLEFSLPGETLVRVELLPRTALVYVEGPEPEGAVDPGVARRVSAPSSLLGVGSKGSSLGPLFPAQGLLDGVNFALPLFLGLTGVLTLREIYSPRDSSLIISPELAASALIGGGLLGWDIGLRVKKSRYLAAASEVPASWKDLALAAELRFEAAGAALRGANFDEALARFEELARDYPESSIAPKSLFESARILFLKGDAEGAKAAYRRVLDDYPLPELHDRAAKGLADCLLAAGDREGALRELEELTYDGYGLTREEMDLYLQTLSAATEPLIESSSSR